SAPRSRRPPAPSAPAGGARRRRRPQRRARATPTGCRYVSRDPVYLLDRGRAATLPRAAERRCRRGREGPASPEGARTRAAGAAAVAASHTVESRRPATATTPARSPRGWPEATRPTTPTGRRGRAGATAEARRRG